MYNKLIEFGILMKIIRLTKLSEYRLRVGKHLSDMSSIRNGLKQVDAFSSLFINYALECAIMRVQVNQGGLKLNGTIASRRKKMLF